MKTPLVLLTTLGLVTCLNTAQANDTSEENSQASVETLVACGASVDVANQKLTGAVEFAIRDGVLVLSLIHI